MVQTGIVRLPGQFGTYTLYFMRGDLTWLYHRRLLFLGRDNRGREFDCHQGSNAQLQ